MTKRKRDYSSPNLLEEGRIPPLKIIIEQALEPRTEQFLEKFARIITEKDYLPLSVLKGFAFISQFYGVPKEQQFNIMQDFFY